MEERGTLAAARGEQQASVGPLAVPNAPVRTGIVGAGFIGAVHARYARPAGARPAGVATSAPGLGGSETLVRDPGLPGPEAAPYAVAPGGHPQGHLDRYALFVADAYAAMRGDGAPAGLPTFADGARSAHLVDAVLAPAAAGGWVEVP